MYYAKLVYIVILDIHNLGKLSYVLCKACDNLLEDTYMDIVARLEVKIINKEDKLKSEITSMEQHLWHKDEG